MQNLFKVLVRGMKMIISVGLFWLAFSFRASNVMTWIIGSFLLYGIAIATASMFFFKKIAIAHYPKLEIPRKIMFVLYILAVFLVLFFGQSSIKNISNNFNIPHIFIAGLQSMQVAQPTNRQLILNNVVAPKTSQSLPLAAPKINLADNSVNTISQNVPAQDANETQDQVDDIVEKIDLLKKQIADLQALAITVSDAPSNNENNTTDQVNDGVQQIQPPEKVTTTKTGGVSGGRAFYPTILISEVQIAGVTGEKEEFVELYNPNSQEVDLTGWYLQRKTKTASNYATFAANTLFSGKKINSNSYFLIAREGSGFSGDVITDNPLTQDNTLALKNPNGDISDTVGWGQAPDYETSPTQNPLPGQSIGRKSDEPDTNNNAADFEIDDPTPNAKNTSHVDASLLVVPAPLPSVKNILINEVQITGKTTKDEFVELYNPNDADINLKGFALKKKTSSGAESNLASAAAFSGTIPALGYFLIIPQTNGECVKNYKDLATADLCYSGKTFSIAADNTVLLYDNNGGLQDKVGFGKAKDFETAPTANPPASKSIERKKLGLDTDDNSQDFKVSDAPTPKGTFPKVVIQDATDYSINPSSDMLSALGYNLLIAWQSASSNIDFYQVQYKMNNGNWIDWLAHTTQTQEHFQGIYSLLNDNTYDFRARATDSDGNVGDWSELHLNLANPIVINEVAFAGTNADSNDQWIELYNKSDRDVDVTGWKIVFGSSGQPATPLSLKGTIIAKGYFILERNDDSVLTNVLADQLFTDLIGKNYLELRSKNNRYVDEFYVPASGLDGSSFMANGNRASQERISPFSFGSAAKNWKINNGKVQNGNDRNGNSIYGTPGQQNSAYQLYTYYDTGFAQDTVLKKSLSPYLFSGMNVQVVKGVILTVEPGVIIKFYDMQSNLTVHGTLRAIGTDADNVVFTSFHDDSSGGDSNGDQDASSPAPGDWLSVYFAQDSVDSQLENVDIRYGGATTGSSPLEWGNALWVDQSQISLKNSVVEKNKNRGLILTNSPSIIDSVTFSQQTTTDWPQSSNEAKAIDIEGGSPEIKNSYFKDNNFGIYITSFVDPIQKTTVSTTPIIDNNNFTGNTYPVYIDTNSSPVFFSNKAQDNTYDAIIFNGDISKSTTLNQDLPYLFKKVVTVAENTRLTLNPGVIMEFADNSSGLQIQGTLSAIGTTDTPIMFRPYYYAQDDISPGSWLGLRFTKTSTNSDLENITIIYGGSFYGDPNNQDFTAAIKIDQSSIILKNAVIQKNANNGIWLVNSPSIIDSVTFLEQKTSTVSIPAKGVYVQGGSPIIKNSDFENNSYGMYLDTWHNPDTGEDIAATPDYSENNQFNANELGDVFAVPSN
jgi:hypothetical protein